MNKKPLCFLDVDDVLLDFNIKTREEFDALPHGVKSSEGAHDFILWLENHFEVRWLTCWTLRGDMWPEDVDRLSKVFDVPKSVLEGFTNPLSWQNKKTEGLDWAEILAGRSWVWIDDGILPEEKWLLSRKGFRKNWLKCNITEGSMTLVLAKQELMKRFNLPE